MSRADHLPARLYARARGGVVQHEGFLEDALAAALELPGVWAELRRSHPAWRAFPSANPQAVVTQLVAGEGRADIHLSWSGGERLIIELKPWAPPSAEQLERYVKGHPGASVSAIARWSVPYAIAGVLPMTTWAPIPRVARPSDFFCVFKDWQSRDIGLTIV